MENMFEVPPMDLKTSSSAEQEVRKLQDMVKRLEEQNEILRHGSSQNSAGFVPSSSRDSVELEEVELINLNDSSDELEDSWLYESPVKSATPAQKSVNSTKWTNTLTVDGLDSIRGNLIDKLDDIETQQEISKVRAAQSRVNKVSSFSAQKNTMFFQPSSQAISSKKGKRYNDSHQKNHENDDSINEMEDVLQGPILRRSATRNAELEENTTLSQSYEVDDSIQGPILRRSAVRREKNENSGSLSLTTMLQSEDYDKESGPILRRSAVNESDPSRVSQPEVDDELTGPILRRSAVVKKNHEENLSNVHDDDGDDDDEQAPIQRRSALSKDTKIQSQINESPESPRQTSLPGLRLQPRSRSKMSENEASDNKGLDVSSQGSQEDLHSDDIQGKVPVVKRSALALPKPSSEGLSKQLWYSGPISQMNQRKTKIDAKATRRSLSPSPDGINKLQPRTQSGITPRRSAGSRGSMEDLLDSENTATQESRRQLVISIIAGMRAAIEAL
ncbi:uncharacterized protein LOC124446634 isoform X2 [Xenia sp. Carnegie-2017]|uniref:uncharacterized protein LOC124446634 isoform X2 n=1 Tax=Xenia sp. Carnegie-2017 TaxID=2897299 RepID=UPI001F041DD2|nr:uncharacterized protein LOC124446634 isoform X2 [Xenia sp. Carnegie-2017]